MKKKLFLITLFVFVMVCLFAFTASADSYNVTYRELWGSVKETISTDENGQITLRDTGYSTGGNKQFLGWYTMVGDTFVPGETVTLTENLDLYEGYGFIGTNKTIGVVSGNNQWDQSFVQLQEDIVLDASMSPPWGGRVILDLNGHTITTSAQHAFNQQRSGVIIVGEGEIIHTGTGNLFNASSHGYGDGNQRLIIGRNVTVKTNGTLINYTNDTNTNIPVHIYGNVTCSKVFHITTLEHNVDTQINAEKLIVTGNAFMTVGKFNDGGSVSINIFGGVLELAEAANTTDYWNNNSSAEYAGLCNITIFGGTFNNGADAISGYIVDGYKAQITEIDGESYITVIEDSNCEHDYEVTSEVIASCIVFASKTYTCKNCGDAYTVTYGTYAEHKWELTNDKQPTATSAGVKDYECSVCHNTKSEKYFNDVANGQITVTVNTANGEKEVSVKVSDIFVLESKGENQYKLTDLKAFGEYSVTDIVAINIPLGIVDINFASNNSTLKKLVISDGAIVTVNEFSKCTALTHIEIGAADVSFVKGCSNNVIESIKSEVEGASVVFAYQVFDGKSSIKELKLSSNSEYIFGGNSFRKVSITEFVAPDYSNVTFQMEAAFYQCNSLKYIYIGRGIDVLGGKPFDYCQYVEKVVLMDVKTISMEWTFCVQNMAEKPVEYYIHSSSISLPNNTFGQGSGIIIYTNAPITNGSAFSSCTSKSYNGIEYPAYTIVYGTPHKYEEGRIEPTCTKDGVDGFLTDCPCGEKLNGDITVQIFEAVTTNNQSYYEITYSSTIIPATGHFEDTVINIAYINGYMEYGVKDCICKVCSEEYTEVSPSATPLYTFLGYSMPEDGRLEISIGFMINNEAIDIYEKITESTVNYGVVIALESKLNGKAPLDNEVIANTQSVELDRKYCGFALKVSGFTEANLDLAVVMAIYVREGDNTVYLQSEQSNLPTSISINKYIADNKPVEVPQE